MTLWEIKIFRDGLCIILDSFIEPDLPDFGGSSYFQLNSTQRLRWIG